MGRIKDTSKYPIKATPTENDYIIGSDSTASGATVNFKLSDLLSLFGTNNLFMFKGGYTGTGQDLYNLIPTKTSQLTNDGQDGVNPFAIVGQTSLQDVIDVNKVADRVEFSHANQVYGVLGGTGVYTNFATRDTVDATKTYFMGVFDTYDGYPSRNIVKLNPDLSRDTSFDAGTGFNSAIYSSMEILVGSTGILYVSGYFTSFNGTLANRIISLNPDGTINTIFDYGTGFNNFTTALAFNVAETHIYIGGIYSTYKGASFPRFVKVDLAGTPDPTFIAGTSFNNTVIDVLVNSDDTLYVTGYFTTYNGVSAQGMAKLLPNGTRDVSFAVGSGFNTGNNQPNYVFRNSAGVLIVYGYFTLYNGTLANHIVALDDTGAIDVSYDFGIGFNGNVWYIEELANGTYVVSGGFTSYNGVDSTNFIILNSDFTINRVSGVQNFYDTIVLVGDTVAMSTDVNGITSLANIDTGVLPAFDKLTFSEVTGNAEYLTGDLVAIAPNEIMPRRLIEELIGLNIASNESGQVKVAYTGLITTAFTAEISKVLDINAAVATVEFAPTTTYPNSTPNNYSGVFDSARGVTPTGRLIENPIYGQVHQWRFQIAYTNKALGSNGLLEVILRNPVSGFEYIIGTTLPTGRTFGVINGLAITIADIESIPSPRGYILEARTSFSDANLSVTIETITRTSFAIDPSV